MIVEQRHIVNGEPRWRRLDRGFVCAWCGFLIRCCVPSKQATGTATWP